MAKKTIQEVVNEWLAKKTKEEGVKALSEEVYYRVLAEGDQSSVTPTAHSIVSFDCVGTNFNGMEICNTRWNERPYVARLCSLPKGWMNILEKMHKGDKWEVYVPAWHDFISRGGRCWGYTQFPIQGILTLEIEIINIRGGRL